MKLSRNEYLSGLTRVFSSAAFFAYNWSLLIFFWDLPFLLLEWKITQIILYSAYQFIFSLMGSLSVTIFIAILGLIFPAKYLRQNIASTGTALVVAFSLNSIIYKGRYTIIFWLISILPINPSIAGQIILNTWVVCLIILPVSMVMIAKNRKVERVLNHFTEDLSVLVLPYVILSLLGILFVILMKVF